MRKKKYKIRKTEFAVKIAKVMDDLKSSHVYFVMQQAFGEEKAWEDCQEILDEILK
jgi:hypothetical protein